MSELKAEMKFEVGDFVYFRNASHHIEALPKRFVVTERLVQECHGGVQRLYKLHGHEGLVPEICLCSDMPPYIAGVKERIEELVSLELVHASARRAELASTKMADDLPKDKE